MLAVIHVSWVSSIEFSSLGLPFFWKKIYIYLYLLIFIFPKEISPHPDIINWEIVQIYSEDISEDKFAPNVSQVEGYDQDALVDDYLNHWGKNSQTDVCHAYDGAKTRGYKFVQSLDASRNGLGIAMIRRIWRDILFIFFFSHAHYHFFSPRYFVPPYFSSLRTIPTINTMFLFCPQLSPSEVEVLIWSLLISM